MFIVASVVLVVFTAALVYVIYKSISEEFDDEC